MSLCIPLNSASEKTTWLPEKVYPSQGIPDGNEGSLKNSLEKNRTKIQKVLGREMTTRNVPKIIFEVDNTFNNVQRINELIDRTIDNEWSF